MRLMTIYQGENKIELRNSCWGTETVLVNEEEVSSKHSFFGTNHVFEVEEAGERIEYELTTGIGIHGVVVSLYREGYPVIESPKCSWF